MTISARCFPAMQSNLVRTASANMNNLMKQRSSKTTTNNKNFVPVDTKKVVP